MKKTISAIILSALLLVSFSACNKVEEAPATVPTESSQATEQKEPSEPTSGEPSSVTSDKPTSDKPTAEPSSSPAESDKPSAEPSSSPTEEEKPATSSNPNESKPAENKPADEPALKPTHKHSYTKKVVAPTCTSKGYTLYTCTCGDSYKDNYTSKLKHTWVKDSTVKPTCDSNGYTNYTCSVCGAEDTANETKAIGHKWQKVKTVKATCTKDGYTSYKCSNCGDTKKGKITDATGHSWGKWKTTQKATEKAEGKKERTCSVCGKKETKSIARVDKYAAYRAPYDFDKIYDDMVAYGKSKGLIYDKSLWVKFSPNDVWNFDCECGFYAPRSFANPDNGRSVSDGKKLYNAAMGEIDYLIERMNLRGVPLETVAFNPFIARTKNQGHNENVVGVLYG